METRIFYSIFSSIFLIYEIIFLTFSYDLFYIYQSSISIYGIIIYAFLFGFSNYNLLGLNKYYIILISLFILPATHTAFNFGKSNPSPNIYTHEIIPKGVFLNYNISLSILIEFLL